MDLRAMTIPPSRLSRLEEPWAGPLAVVRLDAAGVPPEPLALPSCPVIGIGKPDHPLAARVDVVVESSSACESLACRVLAQPLAAATLMQVLRVTEHLAPKNALTVESMAYAMLQGSAEHRAWLAGRPDLPAQASGQVRVEAFANTLHIILDRPWAGNAIDRPMRDGLSAALSLAALDPQVVQVRLRASGKAFSLGADLAEFGTTSDPASAHAIRSLTLPAHAALACADRLVVQVDGACVGAGLELAAFAARVTATPRSWFQLPELAMGIIPGAGGCVSLPRRIGRQRTAEMVLSGRRIGAREALAWGLIDALVDGPAGDQRGDDIA